jgi:MFS family permease
MKKNSVNTIQRKISLFSGSVFHSFHDGIADGLVVFLPLWQVSFGLSLTHIGLLITCFEGATGLFQIPAGILGERYGERILLVCGTLITAVSFMCLGIAESLISLSLLLFIGGVGAAVQHPLADFVDSNKVARAFGLFYTFVIGSAAAAPPLMGRISDVLSVEDSINLIGWVALTAIPMAIALSRQTVKLSKEEQCIH